MNLKQHYNNNEISKDPALQIYGLMLSLAFLLSIYVNYQRGAVDFITTKDAWCWSFYMECWRYRLSQFTAQFLVSAVFVLSSSAAISFLFRKIRIAQLLLLLCLLLNIFIVIQDFRFRSNQYYMLFWVTTIFLCATNKRQALACIICSLYFWSGKLKLNWEWLSGSVLYKELWLIPPSLNTVACAYVVILELLVVWGLLASSRYIFWTAFLQFILFHIQSFSQVDYWYPCLMFLLLSIFPLMHYIKPAKQIITNILAPNNWQVRTWAIFATFAFFQFLPFLNSTEHVLNGSGRFLALHMFEARQVCEIEINKKIRVSPITEKGNQAEQIVNEVIKVNLGLVPRMNCEPIIYYNHARNKCFEWNTDSNFINLDLKMQVRLTTESTFKNVIDVKNFCSAFN